MELHVALRKLLQAGLRLTPQDSRRLLDESGRVFRWLPLSRPPRPADLELDSLGPDETLLVAWDDVSPAVFEAARRRPVTLVTRNRVMDHGRETFVDLDAQPARARRHGHGPKPYARFAVLRTLMGADRALTQQELASRIGVSQPAVSNALKRLDDLVESRPDGWVLRDRRAAFDTVLDDYPGPGGITTFWWSDLSLEDQARLVPDALLSGDLAARRHAAWRLPEHATVYTNVLIDMAALGLAVADWKDYTLSVTIPEDQSVFATARTVDGVAVADPILTAFDVLRTGRTGDQEEAVAVLRTQAIDQRGAAR